MSETATTQTQGHRLVYIDDLRSAIIVLVILHHVAFLIPFFEPVGHVTAASVVLGVFLLLNQGWFMGAFFLLSGYFSPASFERKGPARFLSGRLVRLGIPTLVYAFILGPLTAAALGIPAGSLHNASPITFGRYLHAVNIGPLWFAILLLVFDIGSAGWRGLARARAPRAAKDAAPPRYREIALYVVLFAAANYLIRFVLPLGKTVLQFPSLYDLPEYVSFFCIGVLAARRNWLPTIPASMGSVGLLAAFMSTLILFPIVAILTAGLRNVSLEGLLRFGLLAVIAVPVCFGVAYLIRRLPLVARVV